MPARKEALGPLELDVLRYVADHGPASVREAADHFAKASGHARTTVLTVMERLRAKGYLSRRKSGGLQRYTATAAKADVLQGIIADFVDGVLGGSVSPFVAYLLRSRELNGDEIRKLEQMLKRMEARERKAKP
jgi:predicted transcriptional regulator